ncbi:protein LNK2 isoform X2 [Juglans microcarpa x Juglans regia]|uniref:protein LNK2 isoform X2 n=1 Tax=Juglans microcarpa x Juglans regia TaxID=2249226 RepID=UPI001B7F7149|nr:protein LNK2 isoform X2 [Juglans microcarpa x Juglans regia]
MFDWNDEELANIIWGEGDESGDHIVPYPEASEDYPKKKQWNQETATIKSTELRTAGVKIDLHGRKLESSSDLDTNADITTSGFGEDLWPDLSLSNPAKTDQDSMGTEVSNSLTEIKQFKASRETAQLDKDVEIFQNTHEDKEQDDLVDYEWANIGSFDDLDRIFSNDDPVFGHTSVGNADVQWSSSKDVANSPVKTFPISVDSPSLASGEPQKQSKQFEIKTEYLQHDDQAFTFGHGNIKDPALHDMQNAHGISDHVEYVGDKRKPVEKAQIDMDMVVKTSAATSRPATANVMNTEELINKASRQTKKLKCQRKSLEKNEGTTLPHLHGTWSSSRNPPGQFESQMASSMHQSPPSSMLSQQRLFPGPESLQYQHVANLYVVPSAYGNLTSPYPAMPVLAHIRSAEHKHQPLLSGCDGSPCGPNPQSKSVNTPVKPLTMTPQEKIEKLRRRQQMQALLAIKKQQQQFSQQVPSNNNFITQRCLQESQTQHFEEANLEVEDKSTLPALNPTSPIEQDDSNTVSVAVNNYSVEDMVLYRLQDIISKLDMKLRLRIRDSLFRLAQSAMQRHHASDTGSTNKSSRDEHEVVAKEEINSFNRYSTMPDMETETNPIDRTVAHLLFHRPLELPSRHPDTPESPISTKLPHECKVAGSVNLSMGCLPEGAKSKQNSPHQGSKNSCPLSETHHVNQFKSGPCIDTSENASNNETADGGAVEADASK